MLKELFDYVCRLLSLTQETERNRQDIEELRRELQHTNALLIDLSHKLEHLAEREQLEREKFMLKIENALLRFERPLPPASDSKKRN